MWFLDIKIHSIFCIDNNNDYNHSINIININRNKQLKLRSIIYNTYRHYLVYLKDVTFKNQKWHSKILNLNNLSNIITLLKKLK